MKCPKCGFEFPNPTAVAGGRVLGLPRGFACRRVLQKALATRRRNQRKTRKDGRG